MLADPRRLASITRPSWDCVKVCDLVRMTWRLLASKVRSGSRTPWERRAQFASEDPTSGERLDLNCTFRGDWSNA